MSTVVKEESRTTHLLMRVCYEALKVLQETGGELPGSEVIAQLTKRLTFDTWESERYEKSGYVRWQSILHFNSIALIKAGFLRKQNGVWILTDDGQKALQLSPAALLEKAVTAYHFWEEQGRVQNSESKVLTEDVEKDEGSSLDELKERSLAGFITYITKMHEYDFQEFVAALLRAMGYFTPFYRS